MPVYLLNFSTGYHCISVIYYRFAAIVQILTPPDLRILSPDPTDRCIWIDLNPISEVHHLGCIDTQGRRRVYILICTSSASSRPMKFKGEAWDNYLMHRWWRLPAKCPFVVYLLPFILICNNSWQTSWSLFVPNAELDERGNYGLSLFLGMRT